MNTQNNKMNLLGSVPVPRALLSIGLPTMAGMLINALYSLADTYFVGGLGTVQMAAVTVAYPLGQIVVGLGLLFGNGAAAYLSRLLGQDNRKTANAVASTALYSSIGIGAIAILLSLFSCSQSYGSLERLLTLCPMHYLTAAFTLHFLYSMSSMWL